MKYDIALLGCGKMGSALLHTWLEHNLIHKGLIIEPNPIDAAFAQNNKLTHISTASADSMDADILVLAVKPQILKEAAEKITPSLKANTLVVSIAAGQSLKTLGNIFGKTTAIIRSMPNTPASISKGMTVAIGNSFVTPAQKDMGHSLLSATGLVEWIEDEKLMDAVTALSGSGPAYIFYMIEALAKAGEEMGLTPQTAMTLARQTVIGSAALAESASEVETSQLRQNVTSPKGTTEAALKVLMDGRFQAILSEALKAAQSRSEELNS